MKFDIDQLCINTTTLGEGLIQDKIKLLSESRINKIALWYDDVKEQNIDEIKELLSVNNIKPVLLSFLGPFNQVTAEERKQQRDEDIKKINIAQQLGISTVLALSGPRKAISEKDAFYNLKSALSELSGLCADSDIRIAFEPIHYMYQDDWTFIYTLEETLKLVSGLDCSNLGVMLDLYHLWMEPGLSETIKSAAGKIFGAQLSDWKPITESKYDRGLPGEGCIPLPELINSIMAAGWEEWFDIEIFSNDLWKKSPKEIVKECQKSFEKLAEQIN